jgi:hypothetical protein
MGEQPQPERKIELCTPDIVDLPIINLQDAGRPFKIKVSTIRTMIAGALERFNEYIRAEFLEWYIGLVKSEVHVWFEDRWMVAPLCDERLTTLCGLILG